MNIVKVIKSFDVFNREAVRFFKDRIVNVFLISTENKSMQGMNVNSNNNEININVINKPKVYNLLMCAQRRREQLYANKKS